VPAHRDAESESLNGQATDHEGRPRARRGKEHERGDGEKKSGWHDQQSGVFHLRSFLIRPTPACAASRGMDGYPPDPVRFRGLQSMMKGR
jgi:hypothetical protein